MKSRFSYRIWDKDTDEMFYYAIEDIADEMDVEKPVGDSLWQVFYDATGKQESYIIMQGTGKRDKNNKLIYEEDILLTEPNDGYMLRVEWDKNDCAFIVKAWNGEYFEYKLSNDEISDLVDYEIIGNTYQNPELMRVESLV